MLPAHTSVRTHAPPWQAQHTQGGAAQSLVRRGGAAGAGPLSAAGGAGLRLTPPRPPQDRRRLQERMLRTRRELDEERLRAGRLQVPGGGSGGWVAGAGGGAGTPGMGGIGGLDHLAEGRSRCP